VLPHENDHVGHQADREGADHRLQALLLSLWQAGGDHLQRDRDADADQHRYRRAGPDLPQRVPSALLSQERGDDADDERRLESLPQPDHECRQHQSSLRLLGRSAFEGQCLGNAQVN
jgi:hypothetical protein